MADQKPDDDVFEFLESLGPSSGSPTSSPAEQPTEKELLGFLDELTLTADPEPKEQEPAQPSQPAPHPEPEPLPESQHAAGADSGKQGISSWFGSARIWDSATAAVKGAEAKVRDLQDKSWDSKVKIDGLNKFDMAGVSRTLASTLSSVLHTIAPPIMRHEQLRIHIFHDIVGYPAIDTIVYSVFDRVMQQVEGGELIIVQKGRESKRRDSDKRGVRRDMGLFTGGLEAGEKLAKANVEQIKAKGKELEDEDSPIRKSDIYLSIQATAHAADADELFTFIIYLVDPTHDLAFTTHSQSFPLKWCEWLDSDGPVPGQVDPREWLAEWVEEGLGLAVGVVAQRYVASRMAIGVDIESYKP